MYTDVQSTRKSCTETHRLCNEISGVHRDNQTGQVYILRADEDNSQTSKLAKNKKCYIKHDKNIKINIWRNKKKLWTLSVQNLLRLIAMTVGEDGGKMCWLNVYTSIFTETGSCYNEKVDLCPVFRQLLRKYVSLPRDIWADNSQL